MKTLAVIVLSLYVLSGCTSVASSAVAYAVASQSPIEQKAKKRYAAYDRCLFPDKPNPFLTGEEIAFGTPLTAQYENLVYIAENKDETADPVPPHELAYAFYTIADRIGDKRAAARKDWLKPYLVEHTPKDIEDKLAYKYMDSFLYKCFSVPQQYQVPRPVKDENLG